MQIMQCNYLQYRLFVCETVIVLGCILKIINLLEPLCLVLYITAADGTGYFKAVNT